eukprot:1524622-Pyramimonas_sp.AAC.1
MGGPAGVAPLLLMGALIAPLCSTAPKKKTDDKPGPAAAKKSKAAPKGSGLDKVEADKMKSRLRY